ncbi:MAG TPA: hypothetical protein VMJ32_11210 [Pirellulales bacterium]|nr:hypothetical protein [Pirellulales bacterium]
MASDFWAITAYFNPMHWRRRLANYRTFRQHLRIPLVTVELGYDGQYDLQPDDAEILIQIPGRDVMWQKERLLNVALRYVPPQTELIANLDCDIVFCDAVIWRKARRALQRYPLLQLYSHAAYLAPADCANFEFAARRGKVHAGFSWLRQQGHPPLSLCNPAWMNSDQPPPVTYGMAWAFRRELFTQRGFYDTWVVGGGTRVHFFAAHGHYREAAAAFGFHTAMSQHYYQWAEGFYGAVRGRWGCVPGTIAHLWHGDMGRRKHRQRYKEFAEFQFDPTVDLASDRYGAWRWNSDKPALHEYIRRYIAERQEDGHQALPIPPSSQMWPRDRTSMARCF